MAKSLTISTTTQDFPEQLEFQQLRELGIKHISNLSGTVWTDHNLHDPGITILEVLSYALTDLVYRQNLDIEDLLAHPPRTQSVEDNFFTAAQILTCNPVTIEDYRKMLIDIDGVRNAWLEIALENEEEILVNCPNENGAGDGGNLYTKNDNVRTDEDGNNLSAEQAGNEITNAQQRLILNGLYNVYLELDSIRPQDKVMDACGGEGISTGRILNEVQKRLHQHRNLSEDFLEIVVLEEEQIGLCAELELTPDADPEAVLVDLFKNVQAFLSPTLPFYTLQDLLEKGKSPTEAFAGRPLIMEGDKMDSHGFIDVDELAELERKTEIYVSDLYRVILQDERIRAVKSLYVLNYREGVALSKGEEWCLKISERHRPVLSPDLSRIKFFKGVIPFTVNIESIREQYEEKLADYGKVKLQESQLDLPIPKGQHREDLGDYFSIQRDFPLTYMVGEKEVPNDALPLRKAQAKQLKSYLLFFDQLLADYLSQLTHVRDLFSMRQDEQEVSGENGQGQSYFPKAFSKTDVPHVEELIQYFEENTNGQDALAKHPTVYDSPTERSEELRKTLRHFQQKTFEIDTEEMGGKFQYVIKNDFGKVLLQSLAFFDSAAKAETEAQNIIVLAGEEQSYRTIDRPSVKEYSFEFFYNPVPYFDFIKKISENSSQYFERRNQFLDHLLGRFGEEFTDYVLLMYAMNGKQNEPQKIVEDKTDFLMNYPSISRNRGRAFDYTDSQKIWNTDNVTGLEKKVAKLLGIKDAQRTYFNNFEIAERKTQYYFQYRDHRGQILLESEKGFANAETALLRSQDFLNQFLDIENKAQGEPVDCLTEQIFSFKIPSNYSDLTVIHPYGYSVDALLKMSDKFAAPTLQGYSKKRDSKQSYVTNLLAGKGLVTNYNALEQGFYFSIFNDAKEVQLVSVVPYETENAAWEDYLRLVELMRAKANYRNTTHPLKNTFGYEVFTLEADGTQRVLARNPMAFASKSARTAARNKLITFLQKKKLQLQTEQGASTFSWEIKNRKSIVTLRAVPHFKTTFQSTAAYYYLMKIVDNEGNYFPETKMVDGEKQYTFIIGERGTYEDLQADGSIETKEWRADLAICPTCFDNAKERDDYLEVVRNQLKEQQDFSPILFTDHAAWTYELMNDDGEPWLQSLAIFPNRRAASQAWQRLLTLAGKRENFQLVGEEGFLARGIAVVDQGKIIANYIGEDFENETLANQFIDKVIAFVKSGKAVFADRLSKAFYVEITHPDGVQKIRSAQTFRTEIEALNAYAKMVNAGREGENYYPVGKRKEEFVFELKTKSGELVGQSQQYIYKSERDDAIQEFCDFISTSPQFFEVVEHLGKFDFQVLDEEEEIGLQSSDNFETQFEALKTVWSLSQKAGLAENYADVKEEEGCQFSFQFQEAEMPSAAYHPEYYLTTEERDSTRNRFVDFVKKNFLPFDIALKSGTWYFEIMWETCAGNCEVLLKDTQDYNEQYEAEIAFAQFWSTVMNVENTEDAIEFVCKKVEGKETYTFHLAVFPTNLTDYILVHPNEYPDEATCQKTMEDAKAYFLCAKKQHQDFDTDFVTDVSEGESDNVQIQQTVNENSTQEEDDEPACGINIIPKNNAIRFLQNEDATSENEETETELDDTKYGFRLTAGKESIAVHPHHYSTKTQRNIAFAALSEFPIFSKIKQNGISDKATHGFYFSIIAIEPTAKKLWQSAAYFSTRTEAEEDFQNSYLEIITRSQNKKAYQISKISNDYRLELIDEAGGKIAFHPQLFTKKSDAQLVGQQLRKWAILYPIIKKGKYYGFQIYNAKTHQVDWQSKRLFRTLEEATEAFNEFLELQVYRGNYLLIDEPESCIFRLELGETLLESERIFESEAAAWTGQGSGECYGMNDLLRAIQTENGVYPYFDPHQNCRFSFNVVDPAYRLLKHTKTYLTPADRESARDDLFTQFQCCNIICTDIEIDNRCMSMNYHGVLKNKKTGEKLWQSHQGFSTDEAAEAEIKTLAMQVLQSAREYDYYETYQTEDGIRLSLTDDYNNILADAPILFSDEESVEKAIAERMLFARQYPFVPTKDGVVIELYSTVGGDSTTKTTETEEVKNSLCPPEDLGIQVAGEMVWRSVLTYSSVGQANCDLPLIKKLLATKSNYQRPDASDCGPFSIELVNPKRVLAFHPRGYINRTDLQKGIARTLSFVNQEGFHLVEHILLRPRDNSAEETNKLLSKIPLCLEEEICECVEWEITSDEQFIQDNYLPGADPFSFWVSIFIPFWPKRFQSENFRAFFEGTIRRELPAHMAVRICWISPKQLYNFEDKYRDWLTALSGNGACNFQEAQCDVLEQLFEMRNVYDPAILHGCDDELSVANVYLDQTKLS